MLNSVGPLRCWDDRPVTSSHQPPAPDDCAGRSSSCGSRTSRALGPASCVAVPGQVWAPGSFPAPLLPRTPRWQFRPSTGRRVSRPSRCICSICQHLPYERCAEVFADCLGADVATSTLIGWNRAAAQAAAPHTEAVPQRLIACDVVGFDETGTRRVDGRA
ncbi:transposase (plasmid) [Streptomyces sp. NBC_01216]|uniref:IS66 family transposase n=1 Tax=Streptomyces sp. NBC_01216 TaxID=2903778 RepID=UPI002E11C454|nr:transposase [Streptomyces sp. NBC_01216]